MAEPAGLRAGSAGSSDGAGSGDPAGLARLSSRGPTHSSHAVSRGCGAPRRTAAFMRVRSIRPSTRHPAVLHDHIRPRDKALPEGRPPGARRCEPGRRARRVRLPRRSVGFGQVAHARAHPRRGAPHVGARARSGQGPGRRLPAPRPLPAPSDRHGLPGFPAAGGQERLRQRQARPAGDRRAQAPHQDRGPRGHQDGGPGRHGTAAHVGAVGRRAAAGGHRPRHGQPAPDPAGRRAHRQPRPGDGPVHHEAPRPDQQDGHDGGHGHPRPQHRQPTAQASDRGVYEGGRK